MVAFSGGVDSTFLLAQACAVLGRDVVAATSISAIHPPDEIVEARRLASRLGVRHLCLDPEALFDPVFVRNDVDRCYVCKRRLFSRLRHLAAEQGIDHIAHGANLDDNADYRPGHRAAGELGILAPLVDAGLHKDEIRRLSRQMGLDTWNRPAQACLASRIAYGIKINPQRLGQIAAAEAELARLGIDGGRVRCHGDMARIEVPPDAFGDVIEARHHLVSSLKRIGFLFVALDLEGYVMGSLNRGFDGQPSVKADPTQA